VALARAIVKRPRVLLLDEPLAALDRKLRQEMQIELKRLQHEVGLTFVFVTHDQEEAMTMADRIAVMHAGHVLQVDSPQELYRHPKDHFVAAFIGKMNFLPGSAEGSAVVVPGLGAIPVTGTMGPGDAVWVAIRPEDARVLGAGESPDGGEAAVDGVVEGVAFVGSQIHIHLVLPGSTGAFVVTSGPGGLQPAVGGSVRVAWRVEDALVLPR
jgi:ABC-type Fe3+/spermidine/putrescine transport system ATPase subunit